MPTNQIRKIPYTQSSITELEVKYATDAAANGWGEHCYDYIVRFEEAFKTHLGVKYAIATSSCTGALHMGMNALATSSLLPKLTEPPPPHTTHLNAYIYVDESNQTCNVIIQATYAITAAPLACT